MLCVAMLQQAGSTCTLVSGVVRLEWWAVLGDVNYPGVTRACE